MLIKFLHHSSLKRKKTNKQKDISQYQRSARMGHFVMLDLIRWTTIATAKKKKYKNIAQGSCKWEEEEEETASWGARSQVNRHIQTAEQPLPKPNNCL